MKKEAPKLCGEIAKKNFSVFSRLGENDQIPFFAPKIKICNHVTYQTLSFFMLIKEKMTFEAKCAPHSPFWCFRAFFFTIGKKSILKYLSDKRVFVIKKFPLKKLNIFCSNIFFVRPSGDPLRAFLAFLDSFFKEKNLSPKILIQQKSFCHEKVSVYKSKHLLFQHFFVRPPDYTLEAFFAWTCRGPL